MQGRHLQIPGRTWSLALVLALALFVAACGGGEQGGEGTTDSATEPAEGGAAEATDDTGGTEEGAGSAPEEVEAPDVALTSQTQPTYVNTRFGPIQYGSDFGMDFSDDNFTVFDSHSTATQTALSGRADIVGGSFASTLLVREAGQDFQIFCPFLSNDDFVLAGRNGVETVDDLFDPEVRVSTDSPGGAGDLILNAMLLDLDAPGAVEDLPNFIPIESSGGRATAFAADEVDATVIHLPQYTQASAEVDDAVIVATLYEDVPTFIKEAYAAPAQWLEENRDSAVAFCASVIKANRELRADYELYVEAVNEYVEEPPDEAELEEVYEIIQNYDLWPDDGGLEQEAVEYMVDIMVTSGLLDEVPDDVDTLVNRDILDAAVEMADSQS